MTAKRFILNETSYHGQGAAAAIIDEIKSRGFNKALIVTDADLIKFGVVKKITDLLEAEGFAYAVFDGVKANPSVGVVKAGVEAFKAAGADYMIAVGGGSPQDTAKGIGIIINNPEFADVVSLEGTAPTRHKSVPVIAVATTAGTAAETTINYVITDEEKRRKFVCVDPHDIPVVAIVDPDMMASMPKGLTAATGMDALTHAIEAALSKNANPLTDKDAYWAMQAIVQNLPRAVANGQDEAARTMMAYAENVAGMAFSNAGLGMVHAMAHALGGHYNLPHGVCNAVLLPYVLAFNSRSPVCRERFMTIAAAMGLQGTFTPDTAAPAVIQFVRQLSAGVGIPANLAQLNKVDPADFAALAELALHDTCMSTNQITPTRDEVVAVYTAAFRG